VGGNNVQGGGQVLGKVPPSLKKEKGLLGKGGCSGKGSKNVSSKGGDPKSTNRADASKMLKKEGGHYIHGSGTLKKFIVTTGSTGGGWVFAERFMEKRVIFFRKNGGGKIRKGVFQKPERKALS